MKRSVVFIWLLLSTMAVFGVNKVKVRLFSTTNIEHCRFHALSNSYSIMVGGEKLMDVAVLQKVFFTAVDGKVKLTVDQKELGLFDELLLKKKGFKNSFQLRCMQPALEPINYDDDLIVRAKGNEVVAINYIDIDFYVAGVVEAEGGPLAHQEYYKAQSILCRTYLLSHIHRHKEEGFHLCDQVHCQAYKGRCHNSDILMAAIATRSMALVDAEDNYILAAFHSNCGGQTVPSNHVWQKAMPYLQPVKDTFCCDMPHAKWELKVAKEDWISYIEEQGVAVDSTIEADFMTFSQPQRKVFFDVHRAAIPLKQFRSIFHLRSTLFDTELVGDTVVIHGTGFGHGVGLCQEGAMQMANYGWKYEEILHYYYKDVRIKYIPVP